MHGETLKYQKKYSDLRRCKSKCWKMRVWRTPWARWSAEKSLPPACNRTSIPWSPRPWPVSILTMLSNSHFASCSK